MALARDLLVAGGCVVARPTEPFMSIQSVITYPRASEAPASRRRAEGGEGEAFVLPKQQEGNTAGADAGGASVDKAVAAEAAAAAAGTQTETVSAKASGKGEAVVKPGDVVAKPSASTQGRAQPDAPAPTTGIDFLIAMAAAQVEVAAAQEGEGAPKPDDKPKLTEDALKLVETKAEEGTPEAKGPLAAADQNTVVAEVPHPVAAPVLPLPVAAPVADGAGPSQSVNADAVGIGDGAKRQSVPASPTLPGSVMPAATSAATTETASAGDVTMPGDKIPLAAGHVTNARGLQETSDIGATSKADGTAAAAPIAADPKALDSLQQALGPLDFSAMLQQAAGKPGHDRLVQQLDPNAMPNQAAAAQSQAGGQPTPIHVVPIEIGVRAMAGSKQFDIRLDPDELGRVDVNLSISDKGEVSARLVVDRVETLHLLQRDARTLERAFEQAGLKPSDGGVDISLRDPSDQSAFRQNRQHDEAPQRPRHPQGADRADEAALSTDPAPQRRIVRLGGVDLSI